MSADDHLSAAQFYHGSPNEVEGDTIHPTFQGAANLAHFTTDPDVAKDFTKPKNWYTDRSERNTGYIYSVRPTGEYYPDTYHPDSFKSDQPLKITGRREVHNTWKAMT